MRKKIVAGNWKMNKTLQEGIELAKEVNTKVQDFIGFSVITSSFGMSQDNILASGGSNHCSGNLTCERSCNAKNADELFANEDVDGGLIGGASLKAEDFSIIVAARAKH